MLLVWYFSLLKQVTEIYVSIRLRISKPTLQMHKISGSRMIGKDLEWLRCNRCLSPRLKESIAVNACFFSLLNLGQCWSCLLRSLTNYPFALCDNIHFPDKCKRSITKRRWKLLSEMDKSLINKRTPCAPWIALGFHSLSCIVTPFQTLPKIQIGIQFHLNLAYHPTDWLTNPNRI